MPEKTDFYTGFAPLLLLDSAISVCFSVKKCSNVKNPFTDVNSSLGENQVKAILWAVDKGITKGYSDNTFRPSVSSKRSDVVTFLYRFNDLK